MSKLPRIIRDYKAEREYMKKNHFQVSCWVSKEYHHKFKAAVKKYGSVSKFIQAALDKEDDVPKIVLKKKKTE